MPELYGKPYKYELRAEIAELKRDHWNDRKEHMRTRAALRYACAKIEELEVQIASMKAQALSMVHEAERDITPDVSRRLWRRIG
jgi:hypothetical protein